MQTTWGTQRSPGRKRRDIWLALLVALTLVAGATVTATGALAQEAPDEDGLFVTPHDLEFILRQIQISEAHAEAEVVQDPDYSLVCQDAADFDPTYENPPTCIPHPRLPWGLRTVTGELNNLQPGRSSFGAGGFDFPKMVEGDFLRDAENIPPFAPGNSGNPQPGPMTSYADGGDGSWVYDSQPRLISNLIVDQSTDNPAAVAAAEETADYGSIIEDTLEVNEVWTELSETDDALVYSHTTTPVSSAPELMDARTDGSALYFEEPGGSVEFTITDGFRWIGNTSSGRGTAEVYIDDVLVAEVDQYSANDVPGIEHFSTTGLGAETKTVRIVNTGEMNDAASVARTEIDAIHLLERVVTGGTESWTDVNEDDTALLSYSGATVPVPNASDRTEGSALYIEEAGGSVEFTVSDGFQWIGARGSARGTAEVYIDGSLRAVIDQYNDGGIIQDVLFEATGLGSNEKIVRIVNTGDANDAAIAARTEIDAIRLLEVSGGTGNVFIPNVAPDEGLSAPFTGWFTIFGQFFDHGLDMVAKGGNGTVVIPLRPDDPLYIEGGTNNFIPLTRATVSETGGHINRTTPFIDQNQTYTSHPSHQVFLREYEMVDGKPVPTGHLLDGADGGMATWADVKTQAEEKLGIVLVDDDVLDVPMVWTDPYGRFVPDANGFPQLGTPDGFVSGTPDAPVPTDAAEHVGQAFLDDIAHGAVPEEGEAHDAELLGAHYVAGDGRVNENIALTAVHHIFHSEHNRLVGHIQDVLAGEPELAAAYAADGFWDEGERLFQAARFVTEMQYQHIAIEEFARTVVPTIDNQPVNETAYHDDLDPSVTAEFAHVVYRFGHSMLTDTVDRTAATGGGTVEQIDLFDAFLNPGMFTRDGDVSPDEAAGQLIEGMSRQTGNGIDEFVTDTLRNQLLGLPLDLAAINIARARETGSPSLQQARRAFYAETLDSNLEPYSSWNDLRLALRHRDSIVNFVAAYGDHSSLNQETGTVDELRAAAAILVDDPAFMASEAGLEDIDFWVGGLAEDGLIFGGILGSTFNYVFEQHMEALQNADRFYYLTRTQGLNLLHQLENNSFAELAMRNTEAKMLHADVFANPELAYQLTDTTGETFLHDGAEHIVVHGTEGPDDITGGKGDDSLWGHGGDDRIEGGQGNDTLHGGTGDDILTDTFGDDVIHGGPGNDAINAGSGIDLLFGGTGQDFILHGNEVTTSFAGAGDDAIRGGNANDILTGNEGDDWLEGGLGHDLAQGDNALTFQNDPYGGHDVLFGGSGNDDHDAEGGDDIMLNNGIDRHAGMLGFDWVTHQNDPNPGNSDLDVALYQPNDVTLMRSRYFSIEGLSGWDRSDVLRGASTRGDQPFADGSQNELTDAHIERIDGLAGLLGDHADRFTTTNESNNIILGGAGSDVIEGRAGDDFIDGSSWLKVELVRRDGDGAIIERQDSMQPYQDRIFSGALSPSELSIQRTIVDDATEVCDTAVYSGSFAEYELVDNEDDTWTVTHADGPEDDDAEAGETPGDGSDVLRNIDRLRFSDLTHDLPGSVCNAPATGSVAFGGTWEPPVEGEAITATATLDDEDGVNAGSVVFEWQFANDTDGWTPVDGEATASADGMSSTFVPTVTEAGMQLRVLVHFQDGEGVLETVQSDPTAPVTATTPVATAPAAPTADATSDADGQVTVTWTAPTDDGGAAIDGYDVRLREWVDGAASAVETVSVAPELDGHVFDGLAAGTYDVRVRATNEIGPGDWVTTGSVTVTVAPAPTANPTPTATAPAAPTADATSDADGQVTVTWTAPTDDGGATITTYDVELRDVDGTTTAVETVSVAAGETGHVFEGLDAGTYDVRVRAVNSVGAGAWDTTQSVTVTGVAVGAQGMTDISTSIHASDIETLLAAGVAGGCTTTEFCPTEVTNRAQMATFLANAMELEVIDGTVPDFDDVDQNNVHAASIAALVEAGITTGYGDGNFGPSDPVTRAQMATFLTRSLAYLDRELTEMPATHPFTDVTGEGPHDDNILLIFEAGITSGTSPTTYSPSQYVTREQMATFLVRTFEL